VLVRSFVLLFFYSDCYCYYYSFHDIINVRNGKYRAIQCINKANLDKDYRLDNILSMKQVDPLIDFLDER